MDFEASITVRGDVAALHEAIASEAKEMSRSSVSVERGRGSLTLQVTAKDATALRASLNSVLKLLAVHEKMTGIA